MIQRPGGHYYILEKINLIKHVALIPARIGSSRLPQKNLRILNGLPLIAYTIKSALNSKLFSEVIVSTDSTEISKVAVEFGATVPMLRPKEFASNDSPDIEWVEHCLDHMLSIPIKLVGCVAILRPTSPLRSSKTIINAFETFQSQTWADSLRAMQQVQEHPGKMWRLSENCEAISFMHQNSFETPTHDKPTQSLDKLWVQNASLELIRMDSLKKYRSISGKRVLGFTMPGLEGFDINTKEDWEYLQYLIARDPKLLDNF
jgi:CMP-N,N'-diacetyllegionaminic acid synthase